MNESKFANSFLTRSYELMCYEFKTNAKIKRPFSDNTESNEKEDDASENESDEDEDEEEEVDRKCIFSNICSLDKKLRLQFFFYRSSQHRN